MTGAVSDGRATCVVERDPVGGPALRPGAGRPRSNALDRFIRIETPIFLAGILLACIAYTLAGNRIIESIYRGESIEYFNRLVENHRSARPEARTLEFYQHVGRFLFSRLLVTCLTVQLLLCAVVRRRALHARLVAYFTASTSPINLAIFRIVLFFTIYQYVDPASVSWFSGLPVEFRVAPLGSVWLVQHVPVNPSFAVSCAVLLQACALSAAIGLFSRTSALLTVVLSIYVLGIPQFYGKVSHYHLLVWFAAILATSRCGDVLSADAVIAAWRRKNGGPTPIETPATAYALPLRFVWLLIGIAYFFSGFWKLWDTGMDWFLSDNLKFIMQQKWVELGWWVPVFRIDQYPIAYRLSAVSALVVELSFVFLIFSDRWRLLAPVGALGFHTSTLLFMQIWFGSLVRSYVAFVQWDVILGRLGRLFFKNELYVVFDGNCTLCRRTIDSFRVIDILRRITYVNALDRHALEQHQLQRLDETALLTDMHAVTATKTWTGFAAYPAAAWRLPILWPVLPVLYVWPIPPLGRRIYRRTADSRICKTGAVPATRGAAAARPRGATALLVATGCVLIVANVYVGMAGIGIAWPLAAYPNFAGFAGPVTTLPGITTTTPDGKRIVLGLTSLGPHAPVDKFWGLVGQLFLEQSDQARAARVLAFWRLWSQTEADVKRAELISLSTVTVATAPERYSENPLQRRLVFEARLSELPQLAFPFKASRGSTENNWGREASRHGVR